MAIKTALRPLRREFQQGVATLFMTLVLLLIAGLVLLYTSRGAIMEQRLSANEIRAKQAFASANAGLDHAFSYMSAGGIDHDGTVGVDTITAVSLTNTGGANTASYYAAKYCDPTAALPACPAGHATAMGACTAPTDPTNVIAVACGWSDDDSAVHRVTQRIGGTPSLAGDVPNPLISRGTANLLVGGASIFNYFNDLTVWSGGSTIGQSMTGKTFVRDTVNFADATSGQDADGDGAADYWDSDNDGTDDYRDTGNSPACNNAPTGYTCSTQGSSLGHDVIMADTRLSQGTVSEFFEMFFGAQPDDYRDHTAWVVDPSNTIPSRDSTTLSDIYSTQKQTIWLNGDTSINGTIGTADHPVILIVDGALSLGANAVINGVVYARDAVDSTGTPTIYGALITGSDANTVGNLKVIYDPFKGTGLPSLGNPTKLQGSWKDW
jgi:Tfp pilus assembly protein PilX